MNFKHLIAGVALLLGAHAASATPTRALSLTMDGSGSIDATEFALQADAYVSALNTVFSENASLYGDIAIQGTIFGRSVDEYFATTVINDSTDLAALTAAITGLKSDRLIDTGNTAIGDAVTFAASQLLAYETGLQSDLTLLIDVTTDGQNNFGSNPTTASATAVSNGIDAVNCLGIGSGATCSWLGSAGTSFGIASDFQAFEAALTRKLRVETGTQVPVPATLALLGLGLLGMRTFSRKAS
jgi:hypothetical protein